MKDCQALLSDRVSLVVGKGEKISCYSERGVKKLYELCEKGELKGSVVADRVVGRAAALLMAFGGVKEAYAATLSARAVEVLKAHGIAFSYGNIVDYIVNRAGTGECPMESLCKGISDPEEGYCAIGKKLEELRRSES